MMTSSRFAAIGLVRNELLVTYVLKSNLIKVSSKTNKVLITLTS